MDIDHRFMAAAIRLARRNQGLTATNPSVACLVVADEGKGPVIAGAGVTAPGGRPHAEPIALAQAGERALGATAYVTLEPCAHHGATPPCAQTLIDAGVARVVTAVVDPDERVSGRGHAMLREAGIAVEAGVQAGEAKADLAAYLIHKVMKRPQVTLKLALSADGFLGARGAGQVSITGGIARAQTHLMRARHHAILVGAGTAREDDPELTCRLPGLDARSPLRIVLDPHGTIDAGSKLVAGARSVPVMIVAPPGLAGHEAARRAGCEILACDTIDGRIALPELMEDLGARGIQSLMVEGGAAVARSFLEAGLVDELALFTGPGNLGDNARPVASPVSPANMPAGFALTGQWQFGEDRLGIWRRD